LPVESAGISLHDAVYVGSLPVIAGSGTHSQEASEEGSSTVMLL
jgi:hypothetical protein